jgi:hypothetical protein
MDIGLDYELIKQTKSGTRGGFTKIREILRQIDNNKNNISLKDITGIVLVDEVDKHLRITSKRDPSCVT